MTDAADYPKIFDESLSPVSLALLKTTWRLEVGALERNV